MISLNPQNCYLYPHLWMGKRRSNLSNVTQLTGGASYFGAQEGWLQNLDSPPLRYAFYDWRSLFSKSALCDFSSSINKTVVSRLKALKSWHEGFRLAKRMLFLIEKHQKLLTMQRIQKDQLWIYLKIGEFHLSEWFHPKDSGAQIVWRLPPVPSCCWREAFHGNPRPVTVLPQELGMGAPAERVPKQAQEASPMSEDHPTTSFPYSCGLYQNQHSGSQHPSSSHPLGPLRSYSLSLFHSLSVTHTHTHTHRPHSWGQICFKKILRHCCVKNSHYDY